MDTYLVFSYTIIYAWYTRFLGRHHELTSRVAQVVSRARNEPTTEAMRLFFGTLVKLVIELKLDSTRIFNMDESPFFSRKKEKKVVAVRGSPNVWTTEPPTHVHISYPYFGQDRRARHGAGHLARLPSANSTHLVQPLEVAVFSPLKKAIRNNIQQFMVNGGVANMSKSTAIRLACNSWVVGVRSSNCINGFSGTGLFPPSLPHMCARLQLFNSGGVKRKKSNMLSKVWDVSWRKRQEIRQTILLLPAEAQKGKSKNKRKTLDVGGRLLTSAMITQELETPPPAKKARQGRRNKKTAEVAN
ncbi:hypothetical protein ACHHYP_16311 [Achlya hypogyna]|uniref:DDE-1 domain-containing protein n=1 Tax=Achlya hypogyna TaxID=1202772 RepID=A0A1V9Y978_ACHHY|nr:hypothetical protein ACHHYP_16311 [Achlya hypogyna]